LWHNLENRHKTTTTQKKHAIGTRESDQNKTRDTIPHDKTTQQHAQQTRTDLRKTTNAIRTAHPAAIWLRPQNELDAQQIKKRK